MVVCAGDPLYCESCLLSFLAPQSLVVYMVLLATVVLPLVQLLAHLINWWAWKEMCFCVLF